MQLSPASIDVAIVDLANYQEANVRVFAGRDRGKEVRERAKLDELDKGAEEVEVRVPMNTFAVNSSFFLAMFGPSVRSLGDEAFRKKYRFTGKNIWDTVDSGIKDALHVKTPL